MIAPHVEHGYIAVIAPDRATTVADAITVALSLGRLGGPARGALTDLRFELREMIAMAANATAQVDAAAGPDQAGRAPAVVS